MPAPEYQKTNDKLQRFKIDRIVAMSLWPHFLAHPVGTGPSPCTITYMHLYHDDVWFTPSNARKLLGSFASGSERSLCGRFGAGARKKCMGTKRKRTVPSEGPGTGNRMYRHFHWRVSGCGTFVLCVFVNVIVQ